MLPDHLLLRVGTSTDLRGRPLLANWPAYKFGVEMLLRAKGLEGHIEEGGRRPLGAESRQWQAEDDLCKIVIGFNVKDFSQIFESTPKPSSSTQMTAAAMWAELGSRNNMEGECQLM